MSRGACSGGEELRGEEGSKSGGARQSLSRSAESDRPALVGMGSDFGSSSIVLQAKESVSVLLWRLVEQTPYPQVIRIHAEQKATTSRAASSINDVECKMQGTRRYQPGNQAQPR